MSRELTLYLDDILEAIALISSFTHDMTFQDFKQDVRTQHACIRDLEVIGEVLAMSPMGPDKSRRRSSGARSKDCGMYSSMSISALILRSFGTSSATSSTR